MTLFNKKESPKLFLIGLSMGLADLIPGISGSTIAFISGIYVRLLSSLGSFNLRAFFYLFTFRFKKFNEVAEWKFISLVMGGMILSMLSFSRVISLVIQNEMATIYLYSLFLGLLICSIKSVNGQIVRWQKRSIFSLFIGILFSFFLLYSFSEPIVQNSPDLFFNSRIILSGFLAICAMLLPGVSGSFILLLFGVYEPAIFALASLDQSALVFLFNLGLGIAAGLLIFPRFLLHFMKRYKNITISFLMGLMLGSIYAIWPYKSVLLTNQQLVITFCFTILGYSIFAVIQQNLSEVQKTNKAQSNQIEKKEESLLK